MIYLYYAAYTVACAAFDAWRIKRAWGNVKNINHWLSYAVAVIGAVGLYLAFYGLLLPWQLFVSCFGFIAVRGLIFDGALNLFRRERFDKISQSSNSLNDQRLNRMSFWARRVVFAVLLVLVLIIDKYWV